ncbi:hypothetical protein ACMY46_05050 [Bartonella bacilliformis]|uniref:hypothetical protein n=1 Tax=Bartonella bacilliformis TaxID=774 RepID=UPI0004A13AE6|nr:hypothetical protein H705_00724 [Bartonella bacilliformis Cond044]
MLPYSSHYFKLFFIFITLLFCYEISASGIAMHRTPTLPDNVDYFPYASPDATQKDKVTYSIVETFIWIKSICHT